jgi:hypothetical protein
MGSMIGKETLPNGGVSAFSYGDDSGRMVGALVRHGPFENELVVAV